MKTNDKTIIVSISSGIIARNFLTIPGGFLSGIKASFKKVVLVVPESTKEHFIREFGNEQILVESVPDDNYTDENNSIPKKIFSFLYTYLLFSENAKGLAWEGVYLSKRPKDTWYGRISYCVKWLIGNTIGKSKFVRRKLIPKLDKFIYRRKFYSDLFFKYEPVAVFVPNVEKWQDICLIREARQNNISSIGMPGSWDHLPKRFRPLHPDLLLVNTYTQKYEAVQYQSYIESRVKVVGVPFYDAFSTKKFVKSREEFCNQLGLDPRKKIVFFASEGIYAPDDGDVADMLVEGILNNSFSAEAQLIIRPYPGGIGEHEKFDKFKEVEGVYVDWAENLFDKTNIDPWYPTFSDVIHFINLLFHCDININTYSSIAIEASIFRKQCIGINFDGYKERPLDMSIRRLRKKIHLQNIIETDAVDYANSKDELFEKVNKLLLCENPNPKIEVLRNKMCGPLDGRTGERIALAITEEVTNTSQVNFVNDLK